MTSKDGSVADEYKSSLAELTVNSKPHINMLTMLAEDYIEQAPAIVRAVESHLNQVPGEIKLPVLYLIDSIIKNVGKKYVQLFTQNIVSTFVGVFEKVDEKGRSQMYKLRQTWGGIFPTNKLFKLDTRVNSIDPAWPITASPSPSIHVNPKFLQNQTQQPPPAVLCKREEILKQQKELLELQKRKVELELLQTKAFLAEQQQKTVEKQPLNNIARDPRLRRQENSQNNDKPDEKPVKLKRIPKLKVPPTQEAIQQEVAQYRVLPKSREEAPNVLIFKNLKSKKLKDETPSQEKLLEKRSKREELLKDLQQEQKEAEKIVVDLGKSSKSLKENDQDDAMPSKPKKPRKMPKQKKRKRSPVVETKPEVKTDSPKPPTTSDEAISEPSADQQPQDTDLRLLTAPVPPPPPPPKIPSPEPVVVKQSPPPPDATSSHAKKSKSDVLEPLDGLFGSEDVDLRTFPPPPPVISRPSPPPPLRSPPLFHHVANEKSWANFKGPPRDVPEETTPKFRKNPKFNSPRFNSPIEILDDDENGDDRASENCNLIIRQAEEQLSSGDITFTQYNRLLKEVITMNEERKLQEALKKEKQHSVPLPHQQQPPQRHSKGGVWFRPGRNPHRHRQQSHRWSSNGVPPADPVVLDYIAKDPTRTITVDGTPREVRHYGETAVVFMGWEDPRELSFQTGQRRVYIDDCESYTLQLNAQYREIVFDNIPSKIRLGTPTRELYVDGVFYEASFGGPPVKVRLGNEFKSVRLTGPVPPIRISPNQRKDLVAGKVNMIVDAKDIYPIYLDSKPQRFDISGVPYILRFVEALQTVLINGVPFKIEFGSDLPIPMYFHGEKHYLRFSVLPRGIRPGYVSIVNMEGGRLPSPTPPPPLLAPPPPPVITQTSQPVEVLASLISSQTTSSLSSQNYMVDQPIEPSPHQQQPLAAQLDVTELVQKLVAIGVVPPSSTNDSASATSSHGNKKESPADTTEIHLVDFSKTETMRTRQPGLVNRLFSGIQCSICGVRFPPEHTVKYSQHLDWHFRQNRRERDAMRVAQSRRWYYDVSDWIQFQEIEDQDERTASWFELQKQEHGKAGGPDGLDGGGGGAGGNSMPVEEPSVSSAGVELPASCALCHDPFDQFYHEEKEEWQLKPAIRVGDLLYHPLCHKDLEERGDDEVQVGSLEDLNESLAGPEDDKLETIEIDSEPPGSVDSSAPSPVPGDLDDAEMEPVHILDDSILNDDSEVGVSEKMEEETNAPADDVESESVEAQTDDKKDKKRYDDLDDDILHIEVLEQKIETYELSDEENDTSLNREKNIPESEEELDYSKVTVKAEKMDVCDLVTSQSQPTVVSTIDGNVDLEEATPMSMPKRIKITITSSLGKSSTVSSAVNDADDSTESTLRVVGSIDPSAAAESSTILLSQPPPPGTSPDRLRPIESLDDSEPPPPGEEMMSLPASFKPKLRAAELTSYPPVKRGEELSALCSIM